MAEQRQQSVAAMRTEYTRGQLLETNVPAEPVALFRDWLNEAIEAGVHEPNAMMLATVNSARQPSARMVLLKGIDERGLRFFTNYSSRKAEELEANPHAALVFWWGDLERQVRVEGAVERLSDEESDTYYNSRPRGSRLGAWVSAQSAVIDGRAVLENRLRELEERHANSEPPRPDFWGGYRVVPDMIEFWQGGPNRLHDRLRYRLAATDPAWAEAATESAWQIERLSP